MTTAATNNGGPQEPKMAGTRDGKNRRQILAIYAAITICDIALFMYLSLMPYTYKLHRVDNTTFGWVQSAYAFLQMLTSPVMGYMEDVFGARVVLLINAASSASAHALMGVSTGLAMLVLSRLASLFHSMAQSGQATLASLTDKKDRPVVLGRVMIATSIGLVLGPPLGGLMVTHLGQQRCMLVSWLLPVFAGIIILHSVPQRQQNPGNNEEDSKSKDSLNWSKMATVCAKKGVPVLLVLRLLVALPGMMLHISFPLIAMESFGLDAQRTGFLSSYCGILGIIANGYLVGKLTKLMDEKLLLKYACVVMLLSYLLMSQVSAIWQFCVVLLPWMTTFSLLDNLMVAMTTNCVDDSETGTVVGVSMAAYHFARTLAPLIATRVIDIYGFSGFGYSGFLASVLSTSICFTLL